MFSKFSRYACLITLMVAANLGSSLPAEAQITTTMRFARHAAVADIPLSTIGTALGQARSAFINVTAPNDVFCDVLLARLDHLWWYSAANITSAIKTQADYQNHQANAAHGYALVVNTIKWCGAPVAADGCGWPEGGKQPFIIQSSAVSRPELGIVLAHEFGHTTGLGHDTSDPAHLQIMDSGLLTVNNTKVFNSSVCTSFQWPFLQSGCPAPETNNINHPAICSNPGSPGFAGSTTTVFQGATSSTRTPIEQLAQGLILDRLPVELVDVYGESDVKKLVGILSDSNQSAYHRTTATLIGVLSNGDADDIAALDAYVKRSSEDPSSSGLFALGILGGKTGNSAVVQLLASRLDDPNPDTAEDAAIGLGLTGANSALKTLQSRKPADARMQSILATAIAANQQVAKLGIRRFYNQPATAAAGVVVDGQAGYDP